MSNVVVWGTSISAIGSSQRRRVTSAGDIRVTDDGTIRVAFVPPSQVSFLRITGAGDQRVTSAGDRRVTIYTVSISPDASGYMLVKGGASDFPGSFNSGVGVSGPAITPGTSLLFYADHTNSGGNYWSLPFAVVAS